MARNKVRQISCPNCKHTFAEGENYCPGCGQENHIPNQPLKHYILELIESLLHLDSKFFFTVSTLLTKPGQVTRDYCDNKRARFMPPIRLYVFTSFVFFLILQFETRSKIEEPSPELNVPPPQLTDTLFNSNDSTPLPLSSDNDKISEINIFKFSLTQEDLKTLKHSTPAQIDSFLICEQATPNYFNRRLIAQIIRWNEQNFQLLENFKTKILKFSSASLFFLMPVFALILYLLYWKRKKNYYEFLIFSIHYHILVFIVISILFVLQELFDLNAIWTVFTVFGIYLYLWISLKNHFGQSKLKSFFVSFLAGLIYQIVVLSTLMVVLLLGLFYA